MTNEEKMTPEEAIAEISFLKVAVNKVMEQALDMAIKALSQEPCEDAISREAVLDTTICEGISCNECSFNEIDGESGCLLHARIDELPSVTQKSGKWIPISERLPEDYKAVNITWVNHNPEVYYADIKDKPFVATAHYHNGKWFWFSVVCEDYLAEYGQCDCDVMGEDIEVIAWMPLPKPYDPQESEE